MGDVLLENPGSAQSYGRQFDKCHLPKHRSRPGTTFMATVFSDRSGLFQQDYTFFRNFEEHDEELLPWPLNSPDLNLIKHVWDVLE